MKRPADPRNRPTTTELRLGHCTYLGDAWSILDCPGSIEFAYETPLRAGDGRSRRGGVRAGAGARADRRAAAEALADEGVPHMVFINKIDTLEGSVRRYAGRAAGLCRVAAGAAPGADHATARP